MARHADFYILQQPDPILNLKTACRALETAYEAGLKATVLLSSAATCQDFDDVLWTFKDTAFIPHCVVDDTSARMSPEDFPIILTTQSEAFWDSHSDVLLIFHQALPVHWERYARVIQVAQKNVTDRTYAKENHTQLKSRSWTVQSHTVAN